MDLYFAHPFICIVHSFNQVLARDGYRCKVTRMFDRESLHQCAELEAIRNDVIANDVTVQACHILKEPAMQGAGIGEDSAVVNKVRFHQQVWSLYSPVIQTYDTARTMAFLELFGFSKVSEALKRPHQVCNLLSLEPNICSKFDRLDLWFESTREACYSKTLSITSTDTHVAGLL